MPQTAQLVVTIIEAPTVVLRQTGACRLVDLKDTVAERIEAPIRIPTERTTAAEGVHHEIMK